MLKQLKPESAARYREFLEKYEQYHADEYPVKHANYEVRFDAFRYATGQYPDAWRDYFPMR